MLSNAVRMVSKMISINLTPFTHAHIAFFGKREIANITGGEVGFAVKYSTDPDKHIN